MPRKNTRSYLNQQAYESLLRRVQDYADKERSGVPNRFECHAMNAALDLRDARKYIAELEAALIKDAQFVDRWQHGCNVACANIELWVARCPNCGMPHTDEGAIR